MKKILISTLSIITCSLSLFAQDKEIRAFSLKEAVDYALDNNTKVKNAKLDEQKAKAFNWEIMTQGLPQVSGSVDYSYYFKVPKVPALSQGFSDPSSPFNQLIGYLTRGTTGSNPPDPVVAQLLGEALNGSQSISFVLPHTLGAGFQITQLFFDARYMFGIKARKDLYKTSRLSREMSETDIRYSVMKAYYQAETAQEAKGLLNENLKVVDKLLNDMRATFAQGLIEELDVNRLELAKANLESQINIQNQMADVGLANLKFLMGLPLSDDIILKDKLDQFKSELNLSAENKFDAKNRVEYQLLSTAIILKGYDVSQKRSGYYPSLGGFLNYTWNVQASKFNDMFKKEDSYDSQGNLTKVSPWYPQGIVGISLKVPIFDSGLKLAQVKQAKLERQKTINDFENFKNAAQLQFQASQSAYNTAIAEEANSQKTLDLSKKIFNTNQIKFKEGVGSSFELTQSEQEYATNQLKHMQSIMNLLNAKADLDKAMGTK